MLFLKVKQKHKQGTYLDEEDGLERKDSKLAANEQILGMGSTRLWIMLIVASTLLWLLFMYFMLFFVPCKDRIMDLLHPSFSQSMVLDAIDELEAQSTGFDEFSLNSSIWRDLSPRSSRTVAAAQAPRAAYETGLDNIVFGIAASAGLWETRKEYVKLWWRPEQMRGYVFLDKPVKNWSNELPVPRISEDTSRFPYDNKKGSRSAIRISRIVSEMVRTGLDDVHWFVMGDDDTVFVPENLVKVLSKYDHRQFYYIGSHSESHTQNIHFSYGMAYGGGGFAISYPLAKALEKIQDRCLLKYASLYGSDDRMQACMAELGVPLTKEPGFHQFDVYGDAFGLLTAHPVTPLVSIHHLDVIDPIFPKMSRLEALKHFNHSISMDPAGVLQQSICYDRWRRWSISVSSGYAVQVYRNIILPRALEQPLRTFVSWYRKTEEMGLSFNTRPLSSDPCEQPVVFFMKDIGYREDGETITTYVRDPRPKGYCRMKYQQHSPAALDWIKVIKTPAVDLAPRRQCCRVLKSSGKYLVISVGDCEEDETII